MDGRYADIGVSGFSLIFLLAFAVCLVTYYFLRKRVGRKAILGVIALFLVGYGIRLFILLRNPLIYGIDGPWYISEVGHIIREGAMTEFTAPLVMYFTAGFSVFAGDVTLGIKVSQAFFSALPILTIWLLARYITKNNYISFIAALLVGFSAMTVGMSDVLRNTGALAFLPLFYLFFFKFVNREGREWTIIKTPLKIRGRKLGLTLNTNLVLTLLIFLVILGCHFLTAGFAIMTVVAYVAFFMGYRRKIPWRELKFVLLIGIVVLVGIAASSTLRGKILGSATDIATSEPIPADLFPFSQVVIPTPGDGDGGPSEAPFMFFIPFILLSLPAMWFTLRHHDRRYILFTATIPLALLCSQDWIVNFMYSFRFLVMMYIALFVLMGISIWYIKKYLKKVATMTLAGSVGFSLLTLVGMGAMAGPFGMTEEDWAELSWIGKQLPENCVIMTPGMEGLFYWGPVLFGKELGTTYVPWGSASVESLAGEITGMEQRTGMTCLAVVKRNLISGVENLENFGLGLFDNVQTEHYCVLKATGGTEGST